MDTKIAIFITIPTFFYNHEMIFLLTILDTVQTPRKGIPPICKIGSEKVERNIKGEKTLFAKPQILFKFRLSGEKTRDKVLVCNFIGKFVTKLNSAHQDQVNALLI